MDSLPPLRLPPLPDAESRLAALEERVRWELDTLAYPARPWRRPAPHPAGAVHDVVIVGAGQCGVATAFALRRQAVTDVVLLDAAEPGGEGIWQRFARMRTLRTPKHVTGPELGFPSLSVRAWFEARFGEAAWAALARIGRDEWHAYLHWLRGRLDVPVRHGWRVSAIRPEAEDVLLVEAERAGGERARLLARHVVLATGMDGNGRWAVPPVVEETLPPSCRAHTAEAIDFAPLAGRRVVVLGAGASAFDNAATALEHGAARVDLVARRAALPRVNPNRWIESAAYLNHYAELPDALKWRFMRTIFELSQPPPQDTYDRCGAHPNFHLHLGAPVLDLAWADGVIRLTTPQGAIEADFLICGTGLSVDLAARPELAAIAPEAALWRDRYTPPPGEEDERLGGFPYLAGDLAFTERRPGRAPWLARVRSCSLGSLPSSISSAGISMLRPTVERMANGIVRALFLEQAEADHARLLSYDERELVSLCLASDPEPRRASPW